jgi:hypothetical protein
VAQNPADIAVIGEVVDTSGHPVPSALVRLGDSRGTRTSSTGTFRFDTVTAGWTQLCARFIGFHDSCTDLNLSAGQTVATRFVLALTAVGLAVSLSSDSAAARCRDALHTVPRRQLKLLNRARDIVSIGGTRLVLRATARVQNIVDPGTAFDYCPSVPLRLEFSVHALSHGAPPLGISLDSAWIAADTLGTVRRVESSTLMSNPTLPSGGVFDGPLWVRGASIDLVVRLRSEGDPPKLLRLRGILVEEDD